MTMQEGLQDSWGGPARRRLHNTAYFLDLLGDSHNGLGRHEAAIDALCLFKVADSHLSLGEPWHALGYLQACLPLLHELGLTRHETLARQQLAHCQAELTGVRLPGREPPGARPATTLSPYPRDKGRFLLCPGPTDSRDG